MLIVFSLSSIAPSLGLRARMPGTDKQLTATALSASTVPTDQNKRPPRGSHAPAVVCRCWPPRGTTSGRCGGGATPAVNMVVASSSSPRPPLKLTWVPLRETEPPPLVVAEDGAANRSKVPPPQTPPDEDESVLPFPKLPLRLNRRLLPLKIYTKARKQERNYFI